MVSFGGARRLPILMAATAGLVLAAAVPSGAGAATRVVAAPTAASAQSSSSESGGSQTGRRDRDDNAFAQVNLVSDVPGAARLTDKNLVNGWGLSQGPTTPVWVSDNGADVSTLYAGGGQGQTPAIAPLVVKIPGGAPTGQAFNPTTSFQLPDGAPALFVFAGEHGDLSAWNRQSTPMNSAVHVGSVPGGVLKGLALVQPKYGSPEILVTDFRHGRVVAFDSAFQPLKLRRGAFTDGRLPYGYHPFGIAALGNRVVVTYALRDPKTNDDVKGRGHGFVDVYSTSGRLLQRLVRRGVLNSPWGLAIAPAHFGAFSGDLLVGNFGNGRIHAFDPRTGHLRGVLRNESGRPMVIDGLWGLLPGNGTSAGTDDVWFAAGPQDESHGLVGVLRAVPDPDDR
jgi:uncharacterized protein (TIGR03118 family)